MTPSVTEPPAVDKPPSSLTMTYVAKFGARAQGNCQIFTNNNESCCVGQRPYSSLHGAHNSQPNAYAQRNVNCGTRAACSLIPYFFEIPCTPLAYRLALRLIEIWMQNVTHRIIHF